MEATHNNLIDIRSNINDLNEKKRSLGMEKQTLEAQLSVIRNKIRGRVGRMPPPEYQALTRKQGEIYQKVLNINQQIIDIKSEISKKSILEMNIDNELNSSVPEKITITSKLQTLKSKYMAFASDMTRVSSMRVMASQVAEEIDAIIKDLKKNN